MNKLKHSLKRLALSWLLIVVVSIYFNPLTAQPAGFSDQTYVSGFAQAVGMTFDANGRMYVWEKGGKVWIVENGVRLPNPLLDISEEVGNWRDFGLLGFALDPNFLSNGHIYLLYLVDRHHLLHFGTPSYNANTNEYFDATIGRITRYTAQSSTNFTTVDDNSRNVLMGDAINNGFPNLHQSHGTGSLVFGTDGTLLASLGDGASYSSRDEGSASETYYAQGLADGIISAAENVGAYRSQMLTSYNGKIIRIDPETGAGIPSNPFYQSGNPNSVQSKVWARGLRNPCRFMKIPDTGSHNPADADPGVFYIGDVGWGSREELNVMDAPALNFGWPKYEGMTYQPGYNNSSFAPSTHELAKADWRTGSARAYKNGQIVNIGSSQVPGPFFNGNCSIGGDLYTGTTFPPEYHNTYFHADYGGDWIKNFVMNGNHELIEVKDFKSGADKIVFVAADPSDGSLYYIGGAEGSSSNGTNVVRKISYTGNIVFPTAIASANPLFGTSPLTVQFNGSDSYSRDGSTVSFLWNFGDGTTSQLANPTHTYSGSGISSYTVTLTVTNSLQQTDQKTLMVSLNNTAPNIISTSIDNTDFFNFNMGTTLSLSATVSDAEHSNGQLSYSWQTALHHNDHNHVEAVDNSASTSTVLTPVGCDGATYWYRVTLTVTDPAGASSVYVKDIYPNCPGTTQSITLGNISDKFTISGSFNLNGSSSSGLPLTYYVFSGPATISGNTVTLIGDPGTVKIVATQPGNITYQPALAVEKTFQVRPPVGGSGLVGTYYNNIDFTAEALERTDPVIDFDWQTGSPDPSIGAETFSIRWEGEIESRYSQSYTFITTTDDGVRLWVNNQLIIDQWIDQAATPHAGTISMSAGQRVPIRMEYYENGGGASAILEWQSNSQARQVVPQGYLFPPVAGDTTPPDLTLSTASNNVSGAFTVNAVFSEAVTGVALNDFTVTNGTKSALSGSGANYSFTVTPTNNGNVTINMPANRANDLAGNPNTASNTLNVTYTASDTTPPTVTLSTASNNVSGAFTVNAVFSEVVTGVALNDFTVTNGTKSALSGSGANYSFTITPTTVGAVTIVMPANRANDLAGNPNTASNSLNINYSTGGGACSSVSNIALNKTATQSSEYSSPAPASRAVDGNTSGNWWGDFSVSSTNWDNEAWWEVDLGEVATIETINLWNRTDCCQGFLTDIYVFVSDVPFSSTSLSATISQAGVSAYQETGQIDRPTTTNINRTGRYVRVQKNGSGFIALAEVEVMGCIESGPDTTPPTVTLSTANTTVNGAFTVDATFSESVTGVALNDFTVTNGAKSALSGAGPNYSFTITPNTEGAVTINMPANRANDLAGNPNTASNTLNVTYTIGGGDTTPPSVTLNTASTSVSAAFVVNAVFSETVTEVALNDFTVTNGAKSALSGAGANYSFTVTPSTEGAVTINMPANRANDLAGNPNTASNTLNVNYSTGGGGCNNIGNIALNKPATQSSEYSSPAPASRAVDGNSSGNWWSEYSVSSTAWGNESWWEVDLGEVGTIESINVWNRSDCCQGFLTDIYVFVSDVPFSSTSLSATINQSGVSNYPETGQIERPTTINVNRTGRYVRVQKNGGGFMALAEVEVMGCVDTGPDTTPPTVNLTTANTTVNGAFTVNATFSESVTGVALNDFTVTNGTKSALSGAGSNYSFTVTPTNEGNVSIIIPANRANDLAGNPNTASNTLNVTYTIGGGDTTPPSVTLNTASTSVSAAFVVNAVFSESVTGVALNDFTVTNGTKSALSGAGSNYSFTVTPSAAGAVTITMPANRANDLAGNPNTASNTLNVTYSTGGGSNPPTGYCAAQGNSPWVEWIANVTFGTINNDSGKNLYGNFLNLSTNVDKGTSYQLMVTPGFSWTQYDENIRVWIDFNRDGDFEDTGEQVLSAVSSGGAPQSPATVVNGSVTIPANAGTGLTRMRVSMQRGTYASPCGNFGNGEVEDYLVNIVGTTANDFDANEEELSLQLLESDLMINLNWETNTDFKNKRFELERSMDGVNFEVISSLESQTSNRNMMHYQYTDNAPEKGTNYYRLKQIFEDNTFVYSSIKKVVFELDLADVLIFPNPVDDLLFVYLRPYVGQDCTMQIVDSQGKIRLTQKVGVVPDDPMMVQVLSFENGLYYLSVQSTDGKVETYNFVVKR